MNATADMLRGHILPVAQKLREQARAMEAEEEAYNAEKRRQAGREVGEAESTIQLVSQSVQGWPSMNQGYVTILIMTLF